MTLKIILNSDQINSLDLSSAEKIIASLPDDRTIINYEQQLQFEIHFDRDPEDPREISEIPQVRLWFVRLDAKYPWLPFLLDAKEGQLGLYSAMLVPHQFNRNEGIIYNPEALEIFVMHKLFILSDWFKQRQIDSSIRLKSLAQLWGYDIDDSFFASI